MIKTPPITIMITSMLNVGEIAVVNTSLLPYFGVSEPVIPIRNDKHKLEPFYFIKCTHFADFVLQNMESYRPLV